MTVSAPSGQFILDIGIISTIDTLIDAVKTVGQVKGVSVNKSQKIACS